jgi:hypothetical protein
MARGSSFDHKCSKCAARVMIAPSGQRVLKQRAAEQLVKSSPELSILCIACFLLERATNDDEILLAAGVDEIAAELNASVPNCWRERN